MASAINEGTGHALGAPDASGRVRRRPHRRRAAHRGRAGLGNRAAAAPAPPAAAARGTTAAPIAVGETDLGGLGREARARGYRFTGPPVPRRAAGPAGDGPEVAPRAGAAEMDLSAARRRRPTAAARRSGGAALAAGRGEPALGLRAAPGRAGQTRPHARAFDGP